MKRFKFNIQTNIMDCGPMCLHMVARYFGKYVELEKLRDDAGLNKQGVSLLGLSEAAERIGIKSYRVALTYDQLQNQAPLPAILHWNQNHFIVVYPGSFPKQKIYRPFNRSKINVADPASGITTLTREEFLSHWISAKDNNGNNLGIALLLEPTSRFYEQKIESERKVGWGFLLTYLKKYKNHIFQIFLALLLGSLIQLVFPFLTQSIVDTGINTQNLTYITVILVAQLMLFFGRTAAEFIRTRLLLHISTRVNISILSDFWAKLFRLPFSYFETKQVGDILQRISDNQRIENFITGSAIHTLFSIVNLFIFSIVLFFYSSTIFTVFIVGSILYFFWISLFLSHRRKLDYKRFETASRENNVTMQLIYGMTEIKLNNAEHLHRWEWENLRSSLFKLSFRGLSISQYQQAGAFFINEGKDIFITFLAAKLVVTGELTLGSMLAIQYIIGQLNSPVEQLVEFMQGVQDTKISMERLSEIHNLKDEEPADQEFVHHLPETKTIEIRNLNFTYPGVGNEAVLRNISLRIPEGKITAIVGMSGSGKTTLLKLMLRFYENFTGDIRIGSSKNAGTNLKILSPKFWRRQCGCVMQEGYIFSATIAKNIAVSDETVDYHKLIHACRIANILPFIESLPLGFNTKIGAEGNGISAGQKQRILIARAVYKNPHYVFLDEATNSLDANNEKEILDNLEEFLQGKTVVIVAHRLSTVKNADNIVVLDKGEIVETGTHEELTDKRGRYYELVKNQLELGN